MSDDNDNNEDTYAWDAILAWITWLTNTEEDK